MSFTLKFEPHHKPHSADVFSCERYNFNQEVRPDADGEIEGKPRHTVIRMFRSFDDTDPYFGYVGPNEANSVCYVMNDQGKTVDVIR